jgi:hypothetical protein
MRRVRGRVSREDERGWTAHLTAEDDGSEEIAVYCPKCEEREFGLGSEHG